MDLLDKDELQMLYEQPEALSVSIYMPPHDPGPEVQREGRIRLKNLIREAEEKIRAFDGSLHSPALRSLLEPVRALVDNDHRFWDYQLSGLAAFLSPAHHAIYHLPLKFAEEVVVARRYYFKPLLPLFTGNGRFYLLALSQNRLRLFKGTRDYVEEMTVEGMPVSLVEALAFDDPERQLQFHTSTATPGIPGDRQAMFHGHGPGEEDKKAILRYFHQVDDGMQVLLRHETAPLVLAGVEYLFPIYREANHYQHLLDEGILGNPEILKAEALHAQAWQVVEPHFLQDQTAAVERYHDLSNTARASDDLAEIVAAAHYGRVETLFTTRQGQQWGTFNDETGEVNLDEEATGENQDLFDLAAAQTIFSGGHVYILPPEEMPGHGPIAAVFRYELA